jgi:Rrf2 family iron-sulfur cluster assembly transcriptional regulator
MSAMFSVTADHALRAVLFLGREYGHRFVPAEEIAASIGAPANYLSKTLGSLGKAGIVVSSTGRQGGFALAVAPHRLTLQHVVEVFETPLPSGRCLLGNRPCNRDAPCSAHRRWASIRLAYRDALRSTTVADLLGAA